MLHRRIVAMVVLWVAATLPGVSQANRFSITRDEVANAIDGAGMQISAGQVTLLSNIVSATRNPALKVESIDKWSDRIMVRLECANPGECLPFIVAVRLSGAAQERVALSPHFEPVSFSGKPRESDTIRAGSTAVLFLDGPHVHIQLSVVCLENGSVGQSIRVATRDRRLNFTAEILSDATLRGRL